VQDDQGHLPPKSCPDSRMFLLDQPRTSFLREIAIMGTKHHELPRTIHQILQKQTFDCVSAKTT